MIAFVTGATGFVGKHLARALVASGATVVAALRPSTAQPQLAGVRWYPCDLTDPASMVHEDLPADIDVLFHLAAWTPKQAGAQDADAITRHNLIATDQLLRSLLPRLKRVVFVSSLDVYGAATGLITETTPAVPATLYGASKLFGESLVRERCAQRAVEACVVRLGHVYGPGEDAYRKLVPHTIRRVLAGDAPTVRGDGSDKRDLLYVTDAVAGIMAASGAPAGETVNLCSGVSVSVREIVEIILAAAGSLASIEFTPPDGAGPSVLEFDITKARRVLGFSPRVSLRDGLAREIASVRTGDHAAS